MPLVLPGMISGALFAFITSFDEVVVVLFLAGVEERTIPRQMWSGMREQLSPTILAVGDHPSRYFHCSVDYLRIAAPT